MHSDTVTVSELDALGDELLLDDDSSYLDEASAAPSIPEGIPSDSKTNKVTLHRSQRSLSVSNVTFKARNQEPRKSPNQKTDFLYSYCSPKRYDY